MLDGDYIGESSQILMNEPWFVCWAQDFSAHVLYV